MTRTRRPRRTRARGPVGWVLLTLGLVLAAAVLSLLLRPDDPTVGGPVTMTPVASATPTPTPSTSPTVEATSAATPTAAAPDPSVWDPDVDPAVYAQELFVASNAARTGTGLPALAWDECAAGQAAPRAAALVGQPLAHASLQGVFGACGVTKVAENLSRGAAPAQEIVDKWMASAGHRANLLDPAEDRVGIACSRDGDGLVCSQVFLGHA